LEFVKVYLDDLLIFSKNEDKHLKHLETVFQILQEANFVVNFEKSMFMQKEVVYLGRIISQFGIKSDLKRIEKLYKFKIPTSKKKLQEIFGFIQWLRPFLQNLSKKLIPITDKLKKCSICLA
ncbi:transposable element, partial [Pseudoloma neurophilia]